MGVLGAIVVAVVVRMVAGNTMSVHINQPNAEVYHRQDMRKGEFDYGYHVQTVNNQFQHKVKGPDDVTYGCYGYIDPSNRKYKVYYVADRMGYRIIFPNQATKIFTAKLADSLNKLDGSVKGKDYDEKLVQWNDLYMPDSCFRLDELLVPAATNQQPEQRAPAPSGGSGRPTVQQVLQPPAPGPVKTAPVPAPELPRPTQYTIPTTARTLVDLTGAASGRDDDYYEPQTDDGAGVHVQVSHHQSGGQQPQQPQQPVSLPDINPAHINLDQFSGHVYPIYTGSIDVQTHSGAGQFSATQHSLNITQLLSQIEAVNSQVITLNMLLAGMANNPAAFANANESSCRSVVQLLKTQNRTPQLVYVPILIPYTAGQYNINQPIVPVRGDAHRTNHHGRHH